jgi:hypothetical protein
MQKTFSKLTVDPETQRIYNDALSLKLFGKNVNPDPSQAWMSSATEEEICEWSCGDRYLENLFAERLNIRKKVDAYTFDQYEEDIGVRHYVPPLEEDVDPMRRVSIADVTLQQVKRSGGRMITLCPFHQDKHPSCVLYPNGKGFYCYSCNKGGNTIDWVCQEFGFTFKQAVEFLRNHA